MSVCKYISYPLKNTKVRRNQIDVSSIRLLVLDEADRLCDFEGIETVSEIFQRLPKLGLQGDERLQVCFYSM